MYLHFYIQNTAKSVNFVFVIKDKFIAEEIRIIFTYSCTHIQCLCTKMDTQQTLHSNFSW